MAILIDGKTSPASYFAGLRERLKAAGIRENALAAAVGMPAPQLSRSMQGRLDPRLTTMARLEAAYERLVAPPKGK